MRDRRGAVNLRPRDNMASAVLPPLGRTAGQKDGSTRGSRGVFTREVGILERDIADRWDVVDVSHRVGTDATHLAVALVCPDRLVLMTKDSYGEPLERRWLRPVDKREHLLVDRN